jgi:hypothetical protein
MSRSTRLEVLEVSLAKKNKAFDERLGAHFDSVKAANGQPLNDKRNGQSTMANWDRQNERLRTLSEGIKTTERAIERERSAVTLAQSALDGLPEAIARRLSDGTLKQWRKHPRTFFVEGVTRARIVALEDGTVAHRYVQEIADGDQHRLFAKTFNAIRAEVARAALTSYTGEPS